MSVVLEHVRQRKHFDKGGRREACYWQPNPYFPLQHHLFWLSNHTHTTCFIPDFNSTTSFTTKSNQLHIQDGSISHQHSSRS